jgi:hypothetical protein
MAKKFQSPLGCAGSQHRKAGFAQQGFTHAQLSQIVVDEKNRRHETSI